ncbi:hypothetical protein JW977_01580 [Candidatus Falkowbacteria bacterium]|nr:hypothetical protein [Candidatus Falkowbacteria bacterium]
MINSSKDILLIVLSFCILWFTIFVCWAIYYVAMILREFKKVAFDVRRKIELLEQILVAFKEKLEHTSSYVKLFVESITNLVEFVKERKEEKVQKKKKKE